MDIKELSVVPRDGIGSANSRRLRRSGKLPVILYGLNKPVVALAVDEESFRKLFETGHRVYDLKLDKKEQLCLLKEVQHDSLGENFLHLDFNRIDENEPVRVSVPLNYVGNPVQVAHAFAEYPTQDIEVSCMPRVIPAHIDVDLAGLEVGSHIEASALGLPSGVELVSSPTDVVVTYHFKHAGLEAEPTEEDAEEVAEPEVMMERKTEPEEGEKK